MGTQISEEAIEEVRLVSRERNTGLKPHEAEAKTDCPNCGAHLTLAVSSGRYGQTVVTPEDKFEVEAIGTKREGVTWRKPR